MILLAVLIGVCLCLECKNDGILEGNQCSCSEGWYGIMCDMCSNDEACPQNAPICDQNPFVGIGKKYECDVKEEDIVDWIGEKLIMGMVNENTAYIEVWGTQPPDSVFYKTFNCTLYDVENNYNPDTQMMATFSKSSLCVCNNGSFRCEGLEGSYLKSVLNAMVMKSSLKCDVYRKTCEMSHDNLPGGGVPIICESAGCLIEEIEEPKNYTRDDILDTDSSGALSILGLVAIFSAVVVFTIYLVYEIIICAREKTEKKLIRDSLFEIDLYIDSYSIGLNKIISETRLKLINGKKYALIGPSGAGKTTLLNILSGRKCEGVFGKKSYLKYNGYDILKRGLGGKKKWWFLTILSILCQRSRWKEIPQIFFGLAKQSPFYLHRVRSILDQNIEYIPELKVGEVIDFARKNSTWLDKPLLIERKEKLLKSLSLNEKDLSKRVGSNEEKVISGGELKRVAIISHLLMDKPIMILDEPTTGLDAENSWISLCMIDKRHRKNKNRITIMTIHGIKDNMFGHFDYVVYMKKIEDKEKREMGRIIFCSETLLVVNKLESCRTNERNSANLETTKTLDEVLAGYYNCIPLGNSQGGLYTRESIPLRKHAKPIIYQVMHLLKRDTLCFFRKPFPYIVQIILQFALAFIIGGLYYQSGNNVNGCQNKIGFFFWVCLYFSYASMSSLTLFSREKYTCCCEVDSGKYSKEAWYFSRVLSKMLSNSLIQPLIIIMIDYFMIGLHNERLFNFWYTITCVSILSDLSGIIIGIVSQGILATRIYTAWALFNTLTNGILLSIATVPKWVNIRWVGYVGFWKPAIEALMITEFEDTDVIVDPPGYPEFKDKGDFWLNSLFMNVMNLNADNFLLFLMICNGIGIGYLLFKRYMYIKR